MSRIDWPLALTLAFLFVVMSVVRWRHFRRRVMRARNDETTSKGTPD